MTPSPEHHVDVGAYVLGVLGEADRAAFERHLHICPACAAEAAALADLEPVLAEFAEYTDVAALAEAPAGLGGEPPLLGRLLDDVSEARRRTRRRRLFAVAAAAVLIIGGPVVAATVASGSRTTVAAPDRLGAELHTATDTSSGVTATVGVDPKRWGTDVGLRLSGVKGPLSCSLIAVSHDGQQQVVLNWLVPESGYGVTGSPEPLLVHGGAGILRPDLDHFEVRTEDGRTLVTVPV